MEELLLAFLLFCSEFPSKCQVIQESPKEVTWYICDVTMDNTPGILRFTVPEGIINVEVQCSEA